jgi:uncharacterized protein YbbC (DUF1343 family)
MRTLLSLLIFLLAGFIPAKAQRVLTGAEQSEKYLPLLQGKQVGLVVNHTSTVGDRHLVDYLLAQGVKIKAIFAPEHGFRGDADAGETVKSGVDAKSGLPVISLYGNNKKPTPAQLSGIDYLIFDIQDVGVRFYTYISTMHYAMEAAAEQGLKFMVLDRPNPNGDYIDGPVLDMKHSSFVGMHPIPVVHGLTVGELAQMINGEGWLAGGKKADLTVITNANYTHETPFEVPIKPSPNLPNAQSIRLYPSLCFFEGTDISVGRGTYFPFQVIGFPESKYGSFSFKPVSIEGMSKNPPHENKVCYGLDLRDVKVKPGLDLSYLIRFYQISGKGEKFFNTFFTNLAGTTELNRQIVAGMTEEQIKTTWKKDLDAYRAMRAKYLLYP